MKVDILTITAHPDDIELSCSGTLLAHIAQGKTVGIIELTQGELGTRGTPQIREAEAMEAAKMMGASFRTILQMPDGFFQYTRENIQQLVYHIRKAKPEIVIANALSDRHPDHGRGAKLAADACFYSGLEKIKTYEEGRLQERWRPKAVYHMIQDRHLKPDFIVDISGFLERKMELIMAFRSQFFDPDNPEQNTPISGKDFLDFLEGRARDMGRSIGVEHGEGFQAARHVGVQSLFDLI